MFLYPLSGSRFVLWQKNKTSCGFEIHLSVESRTAERGSGRRKMPSLRNGLAFLLIVVCVIQEQQSRAKGTR